MAGRIGENRLKRGKERTEVRRQLVVRCVESSEGILFARRVVKEDYAGGSKTSPGSNTAFDDLLESEEKKKQEEKKERIGSCHNYLFSRREERTLRSPAASEERN